MNREKYKIETSENGTGYVYTILKLAAILVTPKLMTEDQVWDEFVKNSDPEAIISSKPMLVDLVKGVTPNFSLFGYLEKLGSYDDNRGWSWNERKLKELQEAALWNIYHKCKNSWNEQ